MFRRIAVSIVSVLVTWTMAGCGSGPELTEEQAASQIRDHLCSEAQELCPGAVEVTEIREEGEDVRQVLGPDGPLATFYRAGDGWDLVPSLDLEERIQAHRRRVAQTSGNVRSNLRALAEAEQRHWEENLTYSDDLFRIGFTVSPGIDLNLRHAGRAGWLATAGGGNADCLMYDGDVPDSLQSYIEEYGASPGRLACKSE